MGTEKRKNNLALLLVIFLSLAAAPPTRQQTQPQTQPPTRRLDSIRMRDPFILPVASEGKYYLYGTIFHERYVHGFSVYTSRDLINWEGPEVAFRGTKDFWGTDDYWAPEVHAYRGKYFMFASFKCDTRERGTSILVSDQPQGPFTPHSELSITPKDDSCLDGTLFIDEAQQPWMVYCHEWSQIEDGAICAVQLSEDLKSALGKPAELFRASSAPWVKNWLDERKSFVTDGPFIHRMEDGALTMIWSSYGGTGHDNFYCLGAARSESGKLQGPWKHQGTPLYENDGGHGMIFKTFDGKLLLSMHQPNSGRFERARIFSIQERGRTLVLGEEFGGGNEKADGYRGIWYSIGPKEGLKYSGGFATYPQQIRPLAIYSKEANKTFFCYGGTDEKRNTLLEMVSYFDHATGMVPKPTIVIDKHTKDAHDNPCMSIDDRGHIWIFSNTHGPDERSFIHRSRKPYSIDAFDEVIQTSFSYGSPWFIPGSGFLFINNRYSDGRAVAFQTSTEGARWSEPQLLAQIPRGHYQISLAKGERVGVAFNYHPNGLDTRTNLYYIETDDFGKTWKTVDGKELEIPLKEVINPALVKNYEADGFLVYLKDIQFDKNGRPVLLYLNSKSHMPNDGGPHQWMIAHWQDDRWSFKPFTSSDHNYDFGQLYIEPDDTWRIIAPTDPGAQPNMTGGEIVMWTSKDEGATWKVEKKLTPNSSMNHSYVRAPIDAREDFYALWADGDAGKPSESNLYFANKAGEVFKLPMKMSADLEKSISIRR